MSSRLQPQDRPHANFESDPPNTFAAPRRRPNCHRLRSVGILDPPTSQPRALLFRPRETGEHTLADHGTLELSKRTHHLDIARPVGEDVSSPCRCRNKSTPLA